MLINNNEYLSTVDIIKVKGYSVKNLKYMAKYAATYSDIQFVQTVFAQIPWSHSVLTHQIENR